MAKRALACMFNIPEVGIHSIQVNTSKLRNKEKTSAKNVLETKEVHDKPYIFLIFLFLLSGSAELKDTF